MQKLATKVFIYASMAFGIIGILAILTSSNNTPSSTLNEWLTKLTVIAVFIILPSFAVSVASKYLNGKS